jgi:hypothetical protein
MDVAAIALETSGIASLKPEQVQKIHALCDGQNVVLVLAKAMAKAMAKACVIR